MSHSKFCCPSVRPSFLSSAHHWSRCRHRRRWKHPNAGPENFFSLSASPAISVYCVAELGVMTQEWGKLQRMFSGRVFKGLGQLPAHWGAADWDAGMSNYRIISQRKSLWHCAMYLAAVTTNTKVSPSQSHCAVQISGLHICAFH